MIDPQVAQAMDHTLHAGRVRGDALVLESFGVEQAGASRPQDRTAVKMDAGHLADGEVLGVDLRIEVFAREPAQPLEKTDDFKPLVDPFDGGGPDDGVDAGSRAPSDENAETLHG